MGSFRELPFFFYGYYSKKSPITVRRLGVGSLRLSQHVACQWPPGCCTCGRALLWRQHSRSAFHSRIVSCLPLAEPECRIFGRTHVLSFSGYVSHFGFSEK